MGGVFSDKNWESRNNELVRSDCFFSTARALHEHTVASVYDRAYRGRAYLCLTVVRISC